MKVLTLVSFVSMPLIAFVAVHSEDIVLLLLGDKWIEAAKILSIVAFGAFLKPAFSTSGFVMLSCGQSRKYLRVGLLSAFAYITFMCIGLRWGIVGVAISYALCTYVMFVPILHVSFKETPLNLAIFLQTIWRPFIGSIVMAAGIVLARDAYSVESRFVSLLFSVGVAGALYLVAWLILPGGKHTVEELRVDCAGLFRKV
jgi:PST family polysaccharide transporter